MSKKNTGISTAQKQQANLEHGALQIEQDVWNAWSQLLENYQAIETARSQVVFAEEALFYANERYKVGAGILNDLLDAQNAVLQATSTSIEAYWSSQAAATLFYWSQGIDLIDFLNRK